MTAPLTPPPLPSAPAETPLLSVTLAPDWTIHASVHGVLLLILAAVFLALVAWRILGGGLGRAMEIDEAEIGAGSGKITLKPNWTDRQVAYSVWVELSTRKIGLAIDFDHDVVSEILDSWYAFFGITRDLLKTIPVQKVRSKSTQEIIKISINVLNEGLRPALTKWQARYRRWYEAQLEDKKTASMHPQEIQQSFPDWNEMTADMAKVNKRLMAYRAKLRKLVD